VIIRIKNLRAKTLIGVYPEERNAQRELTLNLTIDYDHSAAVASDSVHDVPDYAVIEQAVVNVLSKQTFQLLEPLADHVAKLVLTFKYVKSVTVEIDKDKVLEYADSVSVTHTLSNH
jgi:D-erythro-7,8-dihydroneopterin triphosphate epimerase